MQLSLTARATNRKPPLSAGDSASISNGVGVKRGLPLPHSAINFSILWISFIFSLCVIWFRDNSYSPQWCASNGVSKSVLQSSCYSSPLHSAYGISLTDCYNISHTCNIFHSWFFSIFCASFANSKSVIEWNHRKIHCLPSVIPSSWEWTYF